MALFAGRLLIVAAMIVSTASGLARAEDPKSLPPVTIEAPPSSPLLPNPSSSGASATPTITGSGSRQAGIGAKEYERCVDVTIGDDTSFGCINEQLRRKVDEVNPVLNAPPIDARSSDLKVGAVNVPAVQQQYGRNFGRSVVPFRPTTSSSPVRGRP